MFRSNRRLVAILLAGTALVPVGASSARAEAKDGHVWGNGASAAPFPISPDSTNSSGLNMNVFTLELPAPLDLQFTVRDLDGTREDTQTGTKSAISLSADVLFEFGKSDLMTGAGVLLDDVAGDIKGRSGSAVSIVGHTDSVGSDSVNVPLSLSRAKTVQEALQVRTGRTDFAVSGKGASDPVADNKNKDGTDNPAGRARNRRVTITIG